MAWFDKTTFFNQDTLRIAHFTDSHLFAQHDGTYFGVNTAQYLIRVLNDIQQQHFDCAIFGGDLTQDHTSDSYLHFETLVKNAGLTIPVFWLPGNHDELTEFERLGSARLNPNKLIETQYHKILLCNSKSDTPAGCISAENQQAISQEITQTNKSCVLFCHHHPIEIQGYLDKHKLLNGTAWLDTLAEFKHVKALFHGHVHNDYAFEYQHIKVFATPATCIQFTKHSADWQQQDLGPAYRIIELSAHNINTEVRWLANAQQE